MSNKTVMTYAEMKYKNQILSSMDKLAVILILKPMRIISDMFASKTVHWSTKPKV